MTQPINGPKSALSTALQGLNREATRVAQAAESLNRAFASAQNAQAADSVTVNTDRAALIPAVEDAVRGAVLPAAGNVTEAVITLLQASTAYRTNLATARVTADLESDLAKILK